MRAALAVGALALLLRAGLVAWAPAGLVGDARAYHVQAQILSVGKGFTHLDGSPAVLWMPGWPALLAGVYRVFGPEPRAGLWTNAVLGAATAALLVILGRLLFDARAGLAAGMLHAVWPGVVYYSAVLMTEVVFAFLVALAVTLLAAGTSERSRRSLAWLGAAGAAVGLATWVRAEALALLAIAGLHLRAVTPSRVGFLGRACLVAVVAIAVVAPWTLRNYRAFERFVPTSANAGLVFWIANRTGATGENDPIAVRRLFDRFAHLPQGETTIAQNEVGLREGARAVRADPAAFLARIPHKLAVTYGSDASGATLIRGFVGALPVRSIPGVPPGGFVSAGTRLRMAQLANGFWLVALALAAIGLTTRPPWLARARWLVLGPLAFWLLLHAVMLAGPRFHFPDTLFLALLGGCGVLRVGELARQAQAALAGRWQTAA
ncbi:MAG: glycosyltransferase family 39 protein [Myxococcota bacterium]|nr:glycosyltransferase family 39 protein [Myxococcota bacterium]